MGLRLVAKTFLHLYLKGGDWRLAITKERKEELVAQYADLLRGSPWAQTTSIYRLADYARQLSYALGDDPEVAEFAGLVSRASQIRALGN